MPGQAAPPTMRESGLGPLMLFGVLTVGAVSGALVATTLGWNQFLGDSGLTVADGDLAEVAIRQHVESRRDAGGQTSAGTASTTSTSAPMSTSTTLAIAPSGVVPPEIEVWSATNPNTDIAQIELMTYGVFAAPKADARLASFIVHDDIVVTSAAAVSDHERLWLRVAGRWTSATLAMADPYTDVAVLTTEEPLPDDLSIPSISTDQPEAGREVTLQIAPIDAAVRGESARRGLIGQPGEGVMTSLNRHCYSAFTITLDASSTPPGSAIIDDDGAIIGMTISTYEPTAAVVPMSIVTDIARSMTEFGSPTANWIGIEAAADGTGRTRLIEVTPDGPAADVLMADDVIVSVDGQPVENPDHLVHLVRGIGTESDATFVVERDGDTEALSIRPASVPAAQ